MADKDTIDLNEEVGDVDADAGFDMAKFTHPDLMPVEKPAMGKKLRRTIVRTAKLINPGNGEDQPPSLVQVPIEPSHNNHGVTDDPSAPLRHYLNKGFQLPHVFNPKKYTFLFCAVSECWEPALYPQTERCEEHERMWSLGWIRYATRNKAPKIA